MLILSIETSCDETAIAILETEGGIGEASFIIRANVVHSQIDLHAPYGGVFPTLAKREHARNLVPVLLQALSEAHIDTDSISASTLPPERILSIRELFSHEPELADTFLAHVPLMSPAIDAIAVTHGPGLEPALWVGVNFARALAELWEKPLIPVNHMEGHIFSAFVQGDEFTIGADTIDLPLLALLVSGGHTELRLMREMFSYELVGQTRDDAAGEAFDKVARVLGLPYPGGPEISRLAAEAPAPTEDDIVFPRPMISSGDYDFSFSGIKTSVLYAAKKIPNMNDATKRVFAHAFQDAVVDVLVKKTLDATREYGARTIVMGGGVAANDTLRKRLADAVARELPDVAVRLSDRAATTDNAVMIGVAGTFRYMRGDTARPDDVRAWGNLELGN
ncbi:MAG: tRNA (adenosine(37)-N6)-threonylcarbamoyltransferase complex transferase subunit TsaD [Candidatus Yonathbacteria bacterium]|nr:tRNA (adenosine(37)-N6)-threonylcarbamoyltransferase complex transferase subunit TsaD [Candidatus Yonathbacteria bacterium]NTW47354.1 tRNA (adenosine(37)-N6)-threonylcarbamoyltransferase complex transferase subunit TsaD [Candidatus Yonathbacteria bacterium]